MFIFLNLFLKKLVYISKKKKWAVGIAQIVEQLPRKLEALSSNSSSAMKEKKEGRKEERERGRGGGRKEGRERKTGHIISATFWALGILNKMKNSMSSFSLPF
jgi:hypothetical protein